MKLKEEMNIMLWVMGMIIITLIVGGMVSEMKYGTALEKVCDVYGQEHITRNNEDFCFDNDGVLHPIIVECNYGWWDVRCEGFMIRKVSLE